MLRNRPVLQMVCIGIVGVAILLPIALFVVPWWPTDASTQASNDHTLYDVLLIATMPIFVLVVTVISFSVWKFRMKPGEEEKDGPPIHGNTRLEVVWTALPAVLILGMCGYSYAVLRSNEASHKGEMTVNVTARQFAFEFSYPQANGNQIVSPELYLPKGRPIVFKLRSLDVIHSFFVPQFSEKLDAVPGITTTLRVTPTRLGTYPAECTELCGAGHSLMRATVRVVTPAAFTSLAAAQNAQRAAADRRRHLRTPRSRGSRPGRARARRRAARRPPRPPPPGKDDLHQHLRQLPHAGRGRDDGHDRPGPDPAPGERLRDARLDEDPRQDAGRVHPHRDHRIRMRTYRRAFTPA